MFAIFNCSNNIKLAIARLIELLNLFSRSDYLEVFLDANLPFANETKSYVSFITHCFVTQKYFFMT